MKRYLMKKRLSVVLMLVFFVCFGVSVFGQEKTGVDDKYKILRDEILSVYKTKGEEGLRDFMEKKADQITAKFIVDFADAGVKERKEEWLKACEIMAKVKKDEKTLADVYYQMGEYFRLISENKRALDYFDLALVFYAKLDDFSGQGNAHLRKGLIYHNARNSALAIELYKKALTFFEKSNDFLGQGNVYLRMGIISYYAGDNFNASELYNKANHFFTKAKNIWGQASVYNRMGQVCCHTGDKSKGLKMYKIALSLFDKLGDIESKSGIFINIGKLYVQTGEYAKAIEMIDKALDILEEKKNLMITGNAYFLKGQIYLMTGDYADAHEILNKALNYFKQFGHPGSQGNVYLLKGIIYFNTGNNQKALEAYDKALYFSKKSKDLLGEGNIYLAKGKIHTKTGCISKALEAYKKALLLFKKVGDGLGEGNIYWRMGEIHFTKVNITRALELFEKALILFEQAGEPIGQGKVYWGKGEIYLRIGENAKALEMYDKALSFYEKVGEPLSLGNVFKSKGNVFFYNGNYSKANALYDKALFFFEKINSPEGSGEIFRCKGDICFENGDFTKSLSMYKKALSFFEKTGEQRGQGLLYYSIGNIYLKIGDFLKALNMYDKALSLCKKVRDIETEAFALNFKAITLARLKKKQEALAYYERSIRLLEKVRNQTAFPHLKKAYMEINYEQYKETACFALENGYVSRGFKYTELMKSRAFLDLLSEGIVKLDKGIEPELLKKRDDYVSKLSSLSKQIIETAGKNDEKKLAELKEERRKMESEFDDLLIKIRLENPLYASVQYPQPVSLEELRKKVLKKGELMLRYFTTGERTYVFLVSRKKLKVYPLNITSDEIQKMANRYILSVKGKNKEKLSEYGEKLYQSLFKPLEPLLKGKKNLIIVPDGHMATIPFESFVTGKDKAGKPVYLLEKYKIKYIQSASVLSTIRKHYKRKSQTKNFIGFGDPVYDYENFKKGLPEKCSTNPVKGDEIKDIHRGKYDREGGILDRLEGSGREVQTIAGLFQDQGQKAVIHLRDNATEENAKSPDLKGFDYIHFSCHGVLGDGFQSLVLSQVPDTKEDGYLTLNEIMNCDYNAKLVVLSACQTGTGKVERGEGATGLTRAVMYAGTPAVVASLWNVSDIGTKELMVRFYQNILEKGMSKEDALREAKLSLLKSGNYSSPFYWSPFVMYGE